MSTLAESVNEKILQTWKKHVNRGNLSYLPLLYSELLKASDLLVIGLNPSFDAAKFAKLTLKSDRSMSETEVENIHKWKINADTERHEEVIRIQKLQEKSGLRYFKKFDVINDVLGLQGWTHIDLFFYREKKQKELEKIVFQNETQKAGRRDLNDFGKEQFELSCSIIPEVHPKIILISNALASHLFCAYVKDKLTGNEYFENHGYHRFCVNSKSVPIFFSSPLSGAHTLDSFSFARLKWQMLRALNEGSAS